MNIFMHPSLLKERENAILDKEQNIEFKQFILQQKERRVVDREKSIKQISLISFLAGVTVGSLTILAFSI